MTDKIAKLTEAEIKSGLQQLPGWSFRDGSLHREYTFADFAEAFGFMVRCALVAQKSDHHPDWSNVYNRVIVDLTTHDVGGVSALDLVMASEMEKAAGQPVTR